MSEPVPGGVEHLRPFFHIVCVVSNPVRFKSRYRLYKRFARVMEKQHGIHFHTVELQSGHREFAVTKPNNLYHLRYRTEDELWHKENMVNCAINHISRHWPDWKYVAWIDADITFQRKDFVNEILQELQVSHWVQCFQHAIDLGPNGETLQVHQGFVWSWFQGRAYKDGYCNWHPGYAWAATKEALTGVGNLMDKAILGAGDRHMAMCLIGQGMKSFNHNVHPAYKDMVATWQGRADRYVKRDIGFCYGTILHHWHGSKKNRRYRERWQILVERQYDPSKDVYYDAQGILRLEDDRIDLRDDIKRYFRSRNEDSIDLEEP